MLVLWFPCVVSSIKITSHPLFFSYSFVLTIVLLLFAVAKPDVWPHSANQLSLKTTLSALCSPRPRTQHLGIKWHHFRDEIKAGWLKVQKVPSADNWSDIFTKPLPRVQFQKLRNLMMGWTPSPTDPFALTDNVPCYPKHAAAAYANLIRNNDVTDSVSNCRSPKRTRRSNSKSR